MDGQAIKAVLGKNIKFLKGLLFSGGFGGPFGPPRSSLKNALEHAIITILNHTYADRSLDVYCSSP
jgi:hypothetical protein